MMMLFISFPINKSFSSLQNHSISPAHKMPGPQSVMSEYGVAKEKKMKIRVPILSMLICLFGVVTTVIPTTTTAVVSCDKALDDTGVVNDKGLTACFSAAQDSVEVNSLALLQLSGASITQSLLDFMDIGKTISRSISKIIETYDTPYHPSNWNWSLGLAPKLSLLQKTFLKNGVSGASLYVMPQAGKGSFNTTFYAVSALFSSPEIETYFVINGTFDGHGEFGLSYNGLKTVALTRFIIDGESDGALDALEMYQLGYLTVDKPNWSSVGVLEVFAALSYSNVAKISDNYIIISQISVGLAQISEFLKELADSTKNQTGIHIAMYTSVASSPIEDLFGHLDKYRSIRGTVGYLTGVSAGEGVLVDRTSDITGTATLLKDTEATDTIIRTIALSIHNLTTETQSGHEIVSLNKKNSFRTDGYIVYVHRIRTVNDIDWWLTIAEEDKAFDEFKESEKETRSFIDERKKQVDSDIKTNRLVVVLLIVGLGLSVLVISALVSVKIFAPLSQLQSSMSDVSDLSLDVSNSMLTNTRIQEVHTIQHSFSRMVKNLREYRAYVPQAILKGDDHLVIPPPRGEICCVFTDIVRSSDLWERSPSSMIASMIMHDSTVRDCIKKYIGYEVKTIGDAFMVVFEDPILAFAFCHEVQSRFVNEKWPESLPMPIIPVPGTQKPLWNGLQVRIGLHYGIANLEENPLTARADYRGSTINTAARLESKASSGTVCCLESMVDLVKSHYGDRYIYKDHGIHNLKGIGDKKLFISVPSALRERFNVSAPIQTVQTSASVRSVSSFKVSSVPAIQKTELLLHKELVTVATIRISLTAPETLNFIVALLCDSASATSGNVTSVAGQSAYVTWNSSVSKIHAIAATRFCSDLYSKNGPKLGLAVGVSSSSCFHGNVGNKTHRFNTVFGQSVSVTEAAADAAKDLGTFSVFVDFSRGLSLLDNLQPVINQMRIADVWLVPTLGRVVLYEILCKDLEGVILREDSLEEITSSDSVPALNESYLKALNNSDTSSLEKLMEYSASNSDDVVYKEVVTRLNAAVAVGMKESRITRPLSYLQDTESPVIETSSIDDVDIVDV